MGKKLNGAMAYYFTEGRSHIIQMIVICHKPAQIINTPKMNCDTLYLTTYNGADLFKIFKEIYKFEHKIYEIIIDLNGSFYNYTAGTANELRYGMIKYNRKEKIFIIFDRNRTTIYDSRVGFLDLKAHSLKDKLESDKIDKIIAYIKPLMINATDTNTINADNYQFYFNKILISKDIKIQNGVLTQETGKSSWYKVIIGHKGNYSYRSYDI